MRVLTYAQQILSSCTIDRADTMQYPSVVDNIIGRPPIHLGLKEAYLPSNVMLDTWFLEGQLAVFQRSYQITGRGL